MARLLVIMLPALLLAACNGGGGTASDGGGGAGGAPSDGGRAGDGPPLPRPINIGSGHSAGLAVDTMGTAYIAWVGPEAADPTSLQFCRLPRGASACDAMGRITADGTSISRPFVIVDGSTVQVLSYRYAASGAVFASVFLFTSRDRGAAFAAGVRVGSAPFSAATLGPGRTVSLVTHAVTEGMIYQAVPLDGTSPAAMTQAVLSTTHPYSGAVGLDGMTPVVAYANGSSDAQLRVYMGSGDVNAVASWSAARDIGKGDRMHMASGSKGLYLLAQGNTGLEVRRYAQGVFSPAVAIPEGTGELAQAHMIQDATGRLHVFWPRIEASGVFLYQSYSDTAMAWQRGAVTTDDGFAGVRAAMAPDQIGLAVWGTASGGSGNIHAVAVRAAP